MIRAICGERESRSLGGGVIAYKIAAGKGLQEGKYWERGIG